MSYFDDFSYGATGAASGATTGALIGSKILPGKGTAIGAGIGGLIGGVSGLIQGRRRARFEDRHNKQAEEEYELRMDSALRNAQMEKRDLKNIKKADIKKQMVSDLFAKALGESFRGKGATISMGYV